MDGLVESLRAIVGPDAVLGEPEELLVYECDGLPQHKHRPRAVVFPSSTEATAEVMRLLARERVPFTPRGAGTGLSGGALALNQGVVIELARLRRVLKIDAQNRLAVVQTGVVNAHVSRVVAHLGLHYVPDPSSQPSCTIGGNIAENAGGIHCLKYGTTTDHVLGARVVLADGEIVDLGGAGAEQPGYDLLGVFVGSEGTFGIATEATLRLVPIAPAVRTLLAEFAEVNDASLAVSAIIAAGVMPAALEMMDHEIIRALEASVFAAGLPLDAGAALLIEVDGIEAGLDDEAERIKGICRQQGARSCRQARDENERKKLWAARKGAFGAIGRISPDSMIQDAVVPRSRLPEILAEVYSIASKYHLRIANVFHAGDGNLHPLICFDSRSAEQVRRVKEAGRELMETCVRAGGSITGEHGVGLDKKDLLPLIFSDDDMDTMLSVRAAFDPTGLLNPGKIIPILRGCGEARAVATRTTDIPVCPENSNVGSQRSIDHPIAALSRAVPARQAFDPDSDQQRLAAIVGEANITTATTDKNVSPTVLVVSPGTIDEAREVMRLVSREGWSVIPAGAGTWLDVGNPLRRVDLIVKTTRLNRIIGHEPADLVATTEAGVTLEAFNATLRRGGQWLPLDPPDDERATTGGVIASGISGPLTCGYGRPRAFVIGMQIVLIDGRRVKAGGRVVKNVAGYDLCKLFTGSYGTLGLIAELTFKLRPVPAETRTVRARGSFPSLISGAQTVIASGLFPVAVELLSPGLAREAQCSDEANDHLLLIRFAGSREAVTYQTACASDLLRSKDRTDSALLREEDAAIWRSLAATPMRFAERIITRASLRPTAMTQLLTMLTELDGSMPKPTLWQAGLADGRLRMIYDSEATNTEVTGALERLRTAARALGGSLVVENAPLEIKDHFDAWGDLGAAAGLMQRVKMRLDPDALLSPGRFAPEI